MNATLASPELTRADRCDRCGAAARVRAMLPSGGELLFCQHHANEHETKLAELAAVWYAQPRRRYLPRWGEWVNILLFTRWRDWTYPERALMRRASRYHAFLMVCVLLLGSASAWLGWDLAGRRAAAAHVTALAGALVLACPRGYVRVFADEGAPMAAVLARLIAAQRAGQQLPQSLQVLLDGKPVPNGLIKPTGTSYASYSVILNVSDPGKHLITFLGAQNADSTALLDEVSIATTR